MLNKNKGTTTITVLITVVILLGCTVTGFLATIRRQNEVKNEKWRKNAYYIAESGVNAAIAQINGVNKKVAEAPANGIGNIGTKDKPESFAGGTFYTTTLANQGANKNIWIITSVCDYECYNGNLVATMKPLTPPIPGTSHALYGGDKGTVLSSNSSVDSYDSSQNDYFGNRKQNGDVGSNSNIQVDSNTQIYGNAQAAPGFTTNIASNTVITGTTANLAEPLVFKPVKLPSFTTPNTAYSASGLYNIIPSGNYKYTSFSIQSNSAVTVNAPARLYITGDFRCSSNTLFTIDNTNAGGVIIYLTGQFVMSSNTQVVHINNPRRWPEPANFRVESTYATTNFTREGDSAIILCSNTTFYGSAYAPNGTVLLNSNTDFLGAFAGRRVDIDSYSKVHYDESYRNRTDPDGEEGPLTLLKWDWNLSKKK